MGSGKMADDGAEAGGFAFEEATEEPRKGWESGVKISQFLRPSREGGLSCGYARIRACVIAHASP